MALPAQLVLNTKFTLNPAYSPGNGDCAVLLYLDVTLPPNENRAVGGFHDNGTLVDSPIGEGGNGMPAYIPLSKGHSYWAIASRYFVSGSANDQGCPGDAAGELSRRFSGAVAYAYFDRGKTPPAKKPKKPENKFLLAGHVKDEFGKPVSGVPVTISGAGSTVTLTTGSGGLYTSLLPEGSYMVRSSRSDLRAVKSADCVVADENVPACSVTLSQDRTADFEVSAPILVIKAALGPYVHGPTYHGAVRAGYAFTVYVTLRNTSRTKRITVSGDDLTLKVSGNAFGGWLQPRSAPVYKAGGATGYDAEVHLSPSQTLEPKESRELTFVVRTQSTSVDWIAPRGSVTAHASPTTPATATLVAPPVAVLPNGPIGEIRSEDVEWRAAAKAVQLEGDGCGAATCTFTLPVDDSEPETPPWDARAFTGELLAAVPPALFNFTWGTVKGLLWDLPNTAAAWAFGAIFQESTLVELWRAVENGPQSSTLWPRYVKAVAARIIAEHLQAPFLAAKRGAELIASVDAQLRAHWAKVANEYYAGDWHAAARTMSGETTEGLLNAVTAVAGGELARLPGALEAANAVKVSEAAAVTAEGAAARAITQGEVVAASRQASAEQEVALLGKVETADAVVEAASPGIRIAADAIEAGGPGFSEEEMQLLKPVLEGEVTGGRKIVAVFQGRSQWAARLKGWLGKPSWMKPKAITEADVLYLGESPANLGTEVWTEPPYLDLYEKGQVAEAETRFLAGLRQSFARRGLPAPSADQVKAALKQWKLRIGEWTSDAPDQVRALVARARAATRTGGRTRVEFVREGNFGNTEIKNVVYDVDFRLESSLTGPADPFGSRRRYIPYASRRAGQRITRIRSDNDPKYFCYENGRPLDDADKLKVLKRLWDDGLIEHPDIGSYDDAGLRAKLLEDGAAYFGITPDLNWRHVFYSLKQSFYVSPIDNRQVFRGLPLVPNLP